MDTTKGQAKPSIANSFQLPPWVGSGHLTAAAIGQSGHIPGPFSTYLLLRMTCCQSVGSASRFLPWCVRLMHSSSAAFGRADSSSRCWLSGAGRTGQGGRARRLAAGMMDTGSDRRLHGGDRRRCLRRVRLCRAVEQSAGNRIAAAA